MNINRPLSTLLVCTALAAATACSNSTLETTTAAKEEIWPALSTPIKPNEKLEARISAMLASMTPEQKVAQMIQPEIRDVTVEDMREYGFGSYLNGGGSFPGGQKHASPKDWIELAEAMYQASVDDSLDGSTIPTLWGTDAVHGHNNVIGATLFPHNIGLGAANNPSLIEKIAAATAKEVMVTGIDWVFAPTVAVVRDDRWGRTYEGYSEDPEIVKAYAEAIVEGLQGRIGDNFLGDQQVISTVKHFLGDGGTEGGDDQGNNTDSEQALFDIHAQGYVGGLNAGAQTVMASFNSWHGEKNHGSHYLLTEVLKDRMGFDGLVVGDWNGHGQIANCSNESCSQAANAGLDIYMAPTASWKPLFHNTVAQVKSGEISEARVNDAVRRILRVKIRAGLFDKPSPANRPFSGKANIIGSKAHREIARDAVRQSLVLLKNTNTLLPLSPKQHVLVSGDGAHNIGKQSGGWSITWQGTGNSNEDFPGATSIYDGIEASMKAAGGSSELSVDGHFTKKPDLAIVVFGEEPYAEGNGDLDNLEYQRGHKKDLALLKKLKSQGIKVVSVFITGRPLWVNPELNASDAFLVAWLPGTEGGGVADLIFSKPNGDIQFDFTGKLSFTWPANPRQTAINRYDENSVGLLPYGFGLSYGTSSSEENILSNNLSETIQSSSETLPDLALFDRAVKTPWSLWIGGQNSRQEVTSSQQKNDTLALRTIDKIVQEDALELIYTGPAQVSISSAFPSDLRSYREANASLVMNLKVDSSASKNVYIGMGCEDSCEAKLDVGKQIKTAPVGQWQSMSIDLQCFQNAGANLGKIFTPFELMSDGEFAVNIADIRIEPNSAHEANLNCQ